MPALDGLFLLLKFALLLLMRKNDDDDGLAVAAPLRRIAPAVVGAPPLWTTTRLIDACRSLPTLSRNQKINGKWL